MQLKRIEWSAGGDWEERVRHCGGHGLHMPAIHMADNDASSIECLSVEDASGPLACAILIEPAVGRLARLRRAPRTFLMPVAPAIAPGAPAREVRNLLLQHARAAGAVRLQVHPGYGQSMLGDEDLAPYRTHSLTEFVIDLRRGYEEILAAMHKIHRKNIRRAGRAGLSIEDDPSLEGLLRLRQLQVASAA
ncbi:hypothetical protein DRQ53_14505, partial [bacterium]